MKDFQMRARREGKSQIMRMAVDRALATGTKIVVATGDQSKTSADLIERTDTDLCEISGDLFVIPHKRRAR